MKRSLALTLCLLSPILMGGAHCGMTKHAGPIIRQSPPSDEREPWVSSLRFRRERADYGSAELKVGTEATAVVRSCDATAGAPADRVIATVRGEARVPVRGACVEVVFEQPVHEPRVELATDIGRTVVLQRNCSPHGPRCLDVAAFLPGTPIGEGDERWTLWSIEVVTSRPPPVRPDAPDAGATGSSP